MTLITMRTVTLVLMAAALSACAASQSRTHAQAPSTWELVRSAHEAFDRSELNRAEREFNRALAVNPDFAPALAGQALVEGARKFYKRADILLRQAHGTAQTSDERLFLNLAWLRFREQQVHEPGLQEPERQQIVAAARRSFKAARDLQPGSAEANYRMGQVYKGALEFDKASEMFYRLVGDHGSFGTRARNEWKLLQRIRQLHPRTKIGRQIALSEELTWGETAALLMEELRLASHLARLGRREQPGFKTPSEYAFAGASGTKRNPTDLAHPLGTIAHLGIRGLEPRGALDAQRRMTRGVFALILEDVLIKLAGDDQLPVRFIDRPSRFSDVRPDHYAYNAIMVTTTLKLLSAVRPNEFGLLEAASGIEALAALQRLKGILRLS